MLPRLRFTQSNRVVSEVVRWATEDDGYYPIDLNPPYQRGAVWSAEQNINLIRSVLMELPVGILFINHRDSANYSTPPRMVDGQQRVRALVAFMAGEFAIPTEWVDDRDVPGEDFPMLDAGYDADTVTFGQLTRRGQRSFKGRTVAVYETNLRTEAEEAVLFNLINFGGVPVTGEDRARAARVAAGH